MPIPLKGDRGAWDVIGYATLHAKDIWLGTPMYHMIPGSVAGQAAVWNGTNWEPGGTANIQATQLRVGDDEGPRVGLALGATDAEVDTAYFEAVDAENVPYVACGAPDNATPNDAWGYLGRAGYPRIHFADRAGMAYARLVPVVDSELIDGPVITADEVPRALTVPAGFTCLYPNMDVPPAIVVDVAGVLIDIT